MDCITYRRIKLATPLDTSQDVAAHAQTCDDCAAFTHHLETFEQDLQAALHVPVADGLAEKIILRRSNSQRFKAAWLPVAATIVVTIAALVAFILPPSSGNSLAREFANHVVSEQIGVVANREVAPDALRLALADFGGQLENNIGAATYVGRCRIDGVDSTHVQLSTSAGNADLLLRPGRQADIDTPETHEGQSVVIMAVPRGSVAIVAETPLLASKIRSLVLAGINFRG